MMMQASQTNNTNNGVARRNGYGHKAGNKNQKGGRASNSNNARPQNSSFEAGGRWGKAEPQQSLAEVLKSRTLTKAEANAVPVFVHGMPNNLCNNMMMEAILEQAGLEEAMISVEARPGFQAGEAVLRLATWEAANYCLRHFDGCHWNSAVEVTAELGQVGQLTACQNGGQTYGWGGCNVPSGTYNGGFSKTNREVQSAQPKAPHLDSTKVKDEVPKKPKNKAVVDELKSVGTPQFSPLASPALTAASTTVPPSPSSLPASSPFGLREHFTARKVSWADLTDDEEDGLEDTTEDGTESGSAQAVTSDDGF